MKAITSASDRDAVLQAVCMKFLTKSGTSLPEFDLKRSHRMFDGTQDSNSGTVGDLPAHLAHARAGLAPQDVLSRRHNPRGAARASRRIYASDAIASSRARGRRRLAPRRGRRRRTRETRAVARADPARVTRRRVVLARRAVRRRRAVRPRPRALDLVSAPRDACPIRGGDERRVRHRRPRVRRLRRHRRPRRRGDAAAERVWTRLHRVLRLVLPARREEARQPRERVPRREHPAGAPSPPHPHAPRRRRVIDATSVKGCVRDSTGHLHVFFPHAREHLPPSLRPSLRLLS